MKATNTKTMKEIAKDERNALIARVDAYMANPDAYPKMTGTRTLCGITYKTR